MEWPVPELDGRTALELVCCEIIDDDDTDECILWRGWLSPQGYPAFYGGGRVRQLAYVVIHEIFVGPIPENFTIDHVCRVRNCVNPRHLEAVSRGENSRRRASAWRWSKDNDGAPLVGAQSLAWFRLGGGYYR